MRRNHIQSTDEINITPMLDIVFILLIFFIVTTSFQKELAIDVSRPSQAPPDGAQQRRIVIEIDPRGRFLLAGRLIKDSALLANLIRAHARHPDRSLVIATDRRAHSASLVTALQGKIAGFESISVASISSDRARD